MKKGLFARMGRAAAAIAAGVVLVVALFPALIIVSCKPFFPMEVALEPPPSTPPLATRTLQSATVAPGTQPGDQILTLDFGEGAVDGLDKADISLTTTDGDCLLSKQGDLAAAGRPGTYTLNIGAVVVGGKSTMIAPVTVSAGGQKPDGTWLTGSVTVNVEFKSVSETQYKVFRLANAHTDGMDYPAVADTKLTLTLTAADQDSLPPIQSPDAILINSLDGLTMNKDGVTGGPVGTGVGVCTQTWELALSQVNKSTQARVEVSVEGYVQDNRSYSVNFHGFSFSFEIPEEDAQANDGTKTKIKLRFTKNGSPESLPRFDLSDISIGSLAVSNIQNTGLGEYTVDVSWGSPANWKHEAEIILTVPDTVITPHKRLVYLSMKKVDPVPGFSGGLAMRRVPGGKFKRDSQTDTISVLTKAYWLGETEVTNKLWNEVMGYNPKNAPSDNYPVGDVSWIEAIVFCNKLSIKAGKTPVYNVNRSYRYGGSLLDTSIEPKEIWDPKPKYEYKVPDRVPANKSWDWDPIANQFNYSVSANTLIDDAFCQYWFGLNKSDVERKVANANRAKKIWISNSKWGPNPDYVGNLDPDYVSGQGDPWNSFEGEIWPDNGKPYPRGSGDFGGGYDYNLDPFGFRTENPDGILNPIPNPAYDLNNTPYTKHPPITDAAGWLAFKTGTGINDPTSDWPARDDPDFPDEPGFPDGTAYDSGIAHGDGLFNWSNEWVTSPSDPRMIGMPFINYENHHYEVQNISVDPNANGYRLPAHHQWIWAAMGADMSSGKLSTSDGISGVNAQDRHKPFAGYNGSNNEADYVWFNETSGMGGVPSTQPVQLKKPNELGLWDMSGNVGEWCYDQAAPETALVNFPGPGAPNYWVPKPMGDNDHYFANIRKVLAGGSYCSPAVELAFKYIPTYIRFMDAKAADQGLRVMRWVQPGE